MERILTEFLAPTRFIAPIMAIAASIVIGLVWSELRGRRLAGALTHSSYELVRAGGETSFYFSSDIFLGDIANIRYVTSWFVGEIDKIQQRTGKVSRLAFIEKKEGPVGAVTLKDHFSLMTGIPSVIVRLKNEIPSSVFSIVGKQTFGSQGVKVLRPGERVILVSDVATSGKTIIDAVKILRDGGANVEIAFVIFDREQGARKNLKENGVNLVQYLKYSDSKAKEEGKDVRLAATA